MDMQNIAFLLLVTVWCSTTLLVTGYKFDKRGCDDMMPRWRSKSGPKPTTANPLLGVQGDEGNSREGEEREDEQEEDDENEDEHEKHKDDEKEYEDLTPATEPSPYKISVNASKYRRNRIMFVRVEGGNFNGLMIQARQFGSSDKASPVIIGSFLNLPNGISTLDCDRGPYYSVSNTAFSKDFGVRSGLVLQWKAPSDDVGSIEFVATFISKQTYWSKVKSAPLLFNEFPPSLAECGNDRSCYRYSRVYEGCDAATCDYLVVTKVVDTDVIVTIGGKVTGDTGYVGIGFTSDGEKMAPLDMCVCMKKGPQKVDGAHYVVSKRGGSPVKLHDELEDEETDVDGAHIWCRFRRPLKDSDKNSVDLTERLFQVFLWGELDSQTQDPVLPKKDAMVLVTEPWNHTLSMNFVHYVGSADIARISWTIVFAMLVATLVELYLI